MGSRKRVKLSPGSSGIESTSSRDLLHDTSNEGPTDASEKSSDSKSLNDNLNTRGPPNIGEAEAVTPRTPQSTRSWYGGTWPRLSKSAPLTQVAKESILAAKPDGNSTTQQAGSTPLQSQSQQPFNGPPRSPALSISRGVGPPARSSPLAATITKLNITSSSNAEDQGKTESENQAQIAEVKDEGSKREAEPLQTNQASENTITPTKAGSIFMEPSVPPPSSTWLGWLSKTQPNDITVNLGTADTPNQAINNMSTKAEALDHGPSEPFIVSDVPQPRSWLGIWTSGNPVPTSRGDSQNQNASKKPKEATRQLPAVPGSEIMSIDLPATSTTSLEMPSESKDSVSPTGVRTSGWAFWSKEKVKGGQETDGPQRNEEPAVTKTTSHGDPPPTSINQQDSTGADKSKSGKRGRPMSMEVEGSLFKSPKSTPGGSPTPAKSKVEILVNPQAQKLSYNNLLLPSFKSTYRLLENPSIIQQIARLLHYTTQSSARHVSLSQDVPRVKRALAIGVHGYFPAPLIRSVLGQPTGTSIRFAAAAAEAIKQWTQCRGYECEIEKVALEGEGRITERIDTLWKLMLNWIEHIQKADFILVACHSQGVPVAMMLVAKLIEFGCVNSARIGVCAMAGVNLGPFPDYKSRLFGGGSAGELFEFSNPQSSVSQRYIEALRIALHHGVRIVFTGSIDDQLVSLESSTFSTVSHPYIYRAVFVDGRVHAPDFITHLVGFALKLRNLGISDHGLIRELSSPLAGSLYSGEGHSRLYEDQKVYELAVEHALETTSISDVPLQVQDYHVSTNSNPFILPWSMRGLLEEEYVRTELDKETTELLEQFDKWKPTSKVLKDVKFRLEAVRSKL